MTPRWRWLGAMLLSTAAWAQDAVEETQTGETTEAAQAGEAVDGTQAGQAVESTQVEETAEQARARQIQQLEEENALLREQLAESQRQSEELENIVGELQTVDESVQALQAFENQRAMLADAHAQALAQAVTALQSAEASLAVGDPDVIDELMFAASVLDAEGGYAALHAAALVEQGDLFYARYHAGLATRAAQQELNAATGIH